MEITIREDENGNVTIQESKDCKEHEVINAYAMALAMKCGASFKKKECALALLDKAYEFSRQAIENMYNK